MIGIDLSLEVLGFAPDLSRLSIEVRDLIRHGCHDGHSGCSTPDTHAWHGSSPDAACWQITGVWEAF